MRVIIKIKVQMQCDEVKAVAQDRMKFYAVVLIYDTDHLGADYVKLFSTRQQCEDYIIKEKFDKITLRDELVNDYREIKKVIRTYKGDQANFFRNEKVVKTIEKIFDSCVEGSHKENPLYTYDIVEVEFPNGRVHQEDFVLDRGSIEWACDESASESDGDEK